MIVWRWGVGLNVAALCQQQYRRPHGADYAHELRCGRTWTAKRSVLRLYEHAKRSLGCDLRVPLPRSPALSCLIITRETHIQAVTPSMLDLQHLPSYRPTACGLCSQAVRTGVPPHAEHTCHTALRISTRNSAATSTTARTPMVYRRRNQPRCLAEEPVFGRCISGSPHRLGGLCPGRPSRQDRCSSK